MDDREWMYTGRVTRASMINEWTEKTNEFLEGVWAQAEGSRFMWCPCKSCGNQKRKTKKVMGEYLVNYGFTPDYTRWIFHGKAHRMRDEVVRQRIDECDVAGGIGDMLDDYEEAHFGEGPQEEEPEASTKAFYEMLETAQTSSRSNKGFSAGRHWTPNGKLPVPSNEDYNNDREFFQEEGLEWSFEIDLTDVIEMEVDNERVVHEAEVGDEVENVHDLNYLSDCV